MNQKTEATQPRSILIIGIAGGLAKITASLIARDYPGTKILGVDSRPIQGMTHYPNLQYKHINYTRGQFEKLFRDYNFDLVFHLGRMGHTQNSNAQLAARLDQNLIGTKRILDLSLKFGVKRMVILSTYHVYGALKDNPVFIDEDAPLRASIRHPELRDVVEMDQIVSNWIWRYKDQMDTVVLRPCSIIGPQINNSMSKYLMAAHAPLPIDFNPMFQFIHEFDMAQMLVHSGYRLPPGAYNVAPSETISLREAKKLINVPTIPIPIFLLEQAVNLMRTPLWKFPGYLIDYLKFACIIDNSQLLKYLPNQGKDAFRYSTREALELLRIN